MEFKEFYQKYRRMCDYCSRCSECPRADEPNCNIEEISDEELENFVNTVEQWSKEHSPRTRLQDFLEKYPDALMCEDGTPESCCKSLGYCKTCKRDKDGGCPGCWDTPVEEDE